MIIWIAALVFFGFAGMVGFYLGFIRVAFSLIGLIVASFLAFPLGHLTYSILGTCGVLNPVYQWLLGPVVVFVLIMIGFKTAGFAVHHQVNVYYKYKAGDLRLGLWERLTSRLGICFGLANAAVYLILISLVVYVLSYGTSQIVINPADLPGSIRTLNSLGLAVQQSGMSKIVSAIDPMPPGYYDAVDIVGLIYHNDLLEGRLSRYPAFLSLAERPEFQDIAGDKDFSEYRMQQPAFIDLLKQGRSQNIINNYQLLNDLWAAAEPNLKDLKDFLNTGASATFDSEKILGRWDFNVPAAVLQAKDDRPNISSAQMASLRHILMAVLGTSTLVAAPDKELFLKHFGTIRAPNRPKAPPTIEYSELTGTWESVGDAKYKLSLSGVPGAKGTLEATIDTDKMTITGSSLPIKFDREF